MRERMDPRTLKKWLVLAALVYFLFPYDLIPDFAGLPGRIDDVLMMVGLAWFYRNRTKQFRAAGREASAAGPEDAKAFDPYAVLGIAPTASREAIQSAYRARMQEYHPDKVAHLGEELQTLALEKSQQIQRAYQELRE